MFQMAHRDKYDRYRSHCLQGGVIGFGHGSFYRKHGGFVPSSNVI